MFEIAKPIFIPYQHKGPVISAFFAANFESDGQQAELKITGSARYKVTVNGSFAGHGPEQGSGYYSSTDIWDISDLVSWGLNQIVIEAVYHDQPHGAFIQAELSADGNIVAATGKNFIAFADLERVQEVEIEDGRIPEVYERTGCCMVPAKVKVLLPETIAVKRESPYPQYSMFYPEAAGRGPFPLEEGAWVTLDMKGRVRGFLKTLLQAETKAKVEISFATSLHQEPEAKVRFVLQPGEYEHETFDVYDFRYLTLSVLEGRAVLKEVSLREVK